MTDGSLKKTLMGKREQIELDGYRSVLNHHLCVALVDTQGIVREMSHDQCPITGVKRDEILHKHVQKINLYPTDHPTLTEMLDALQKGHPWQGELQYLIYRQKPVWLHLMVTPYRQSQQDDWQYLVVLKNINRVKTLESEFRLALKMLHLNLNTNLNLSEKKERSVQRALFCMEDSLCQLMGIIKHEDVPENCHLDSRSE